MTKFPKYLRGCHVALWEDTTAKHLPLCWTVLIGGQWFPMYYTDTTDFYNRPWNTKLASFDTGFVEDSLIRVLKWKKLKQFQVA